MIHSMTTKTEEKMSLMETNFKNAGMTLLDTASDGYRTWVGENFSIKEITGNGKRPYRVQFNGEKADSFKNGHRAHSFSNWIKALNFALEDHNEYWKK